MAVRLDGWKPYEPELEEAFGWDVLRDPDPSTWLTAEEFALLIPFLDAVRDGREAGERADEAFSRSRDAVDDVEREEASRDRNIASGAMNDARMQRQLLDRGDLGNARSRAEERLRILRNGLDLPPHLDVSR